MLPNFHILGAQKAGTTWLAQMLGQHRDVFIPRCKELHYFTKEERFCRGTRWYRTRFLKSGPAKAIGEATPNYLAANTAKGRHVVERIHALTPGARFVVSLRHPGERAQAALFHHARMGRLAPWADFDRVLLGMIEGSEQDPWDVLPMGRYDEQLEAYFDRFPRDRFQILISEEDLRGKRSDTLRVVCHHLGIPADWTFRSEQVDSNVSVRSRIGLALACAGRFGGGTQVARVLERRGWLPRIVFSRSTLAAMDEYYRPSVARLETMLGRSLELWRRPRA